MSFPPLPHDPPATAPDAGDSPEPWVEPTDLELPALEQRTRHWLDPVCGWLALAVPLLITLTRVSASTQWRDDMAVVRGLGLVPIGAEGTLSTLLMQVLAMLPVGGRLLRASLGSAVGLSLAAGLVYVLARRTLDANAATPRLTPPLALAASLTATLSATWQLEGTVAGGSTLAVALLFAGLLLRPSSRTRDARVWLGFGALAALTALESHTAALALLGALGVQVLVLSELPPRRSVVLFLVGGASVAVVGLLPLLARSLGNDALVDLGFGLGTAQISAEDVAAERPGTLAVWLRDVGVVSVALALGGAAWGMARAKLRWLVAPLLALVVADLVFPASRAGVLSADPLAPLRLAALAALAVGSVLGVHTVALGLNRAQMPMARTASMLLVMFTFTLVFVTGEDSSYVADRRQQVAAEVWTDEALGSLPPHSLLLVRSPAVAWRLWAARLVRGERPDLVVVPLALVERGNLAQHLVEMEPELAPLIRELVVRGHPTEYALSTLSDARPLYVELDPRWDRRLYEHLIPQPLWLEFAPHALGRSDRLPQIAGGRRAFRRVLDVAVQPTYRDEATLAVLRARASEQATALAALGDRDSVRGVLADLRAIDAKCPLAEEIEARFEKDTRGAINVAGLLW